MSGKTGEIKLISKLARNYTMEGVSEALAYLLIKIVPAIKVPATRIPANIGLLIDVSRSMKGEKLGAAKEAAKLVVGNLSVDDTMSITVFSDDAVSLFPANKVIDKEAIYSAIDSIEVLGGSRMYQGLEIAMKETERVSSPNMVNRILLLTDGETEGEEQCLRIAGEQKMKNIGITAFGIGDEYNEDFLEELANATLGTHYYLQDYTQITSGFLREITAILSTYVTNSRLSLNLVNNVQLDEIFRIYPDNAKLQPEVQADGNIVSVFVGNLRKDEQTIFGARLKLPQRKEGSTRIAQAFLSYSIPGLELEDKMAKSQIVVEYTGDRDLLSGFDSEVTTYFSQINVSNLIQNAVTEARTGNIQGATMALGQAKVFTQSIGNASLTMNIDSALGELQKTCAIPASIIKTIRAGSSHSINIEEGFR